MPPNLSLRREEPISTRPSFLARRPARWRENLAVFMLVIGMLQFALFMCHLVWLGECWLARLAWSL